MSWTELQISSEKHVTPLDGVRIIYAVRCEGFSISLYRVEYQEDCCWINRREFGLKRLFANHGAFRDLPTGTEVNKNTFSVTAVSSEIRNKHIPNTSLEDRICSGTQEIPLISRKPEVRYRNPEPH